MKILTFSTLYPNAARPRHGIFVETQLRQQLASGQVESMVVAPVPWFPSRNPLFGEYAVHASAPREEQRHGIQVLHPRYLVLPKIGMTLAPFLLAQSVKPVIERVLAEYRFDLIDAHYFYPDGVAAVLLGRRFGKPVVITALGTDVNLIPRYRLPRRMILWAARHAAGIITVARALKDKLVALGVPAGRIEVLRNGVDLQLFRPVDRESWRRRLGFRRTTLLSVGNLVPLKGHDLAIRALRLLPEMDLVIIGNGPERAALGTLARELGVSDRVTFVGVMAQEDLASLLRRRRCAGPGVQPRGLGQRAAGIDGVRNAGDRQQGRGHAGSSDRAGSRIDDGGAHPGGVSGRGAQVIRTLSGPRRDAALCGGIQLGRNHRGPAAALQPDSLKPGSQDQIKQTDERR